jgi:low temperature requirement protein LtrA
MAVATPGTPVEPAIRVSTLELFFDLVFVFTITQLTDVLVHHLDAVGVARVLVMLGVIWWMYGGYAWLTNAVAPSSTTRRTLLLTGMAGFLVIALAVPGAFGASGWIFGMGYLVVNLVHLVLFIRAGDERVVRGVWGLAPLNLASALLVLTGGVLSGPVRYVLWAGALAVQVITPYLHRMGYSIAPSHFVERHGLVIIIAIGESVVAVGVGSAGRPIDLGIVAVAVLGLCVAYYLWWAYFAGDDARAEHVLETTDPARRPRLAVRAWGFAHYPMLLGIIVLAAGVKSTVGRAYEPLAWPSATALGTGAALFLLGHAWFLRILRLRGVAHRLAAAGGTLAAIPIGRIGAAAELAAIAFVMATAMIVEDVPQALRQRNTALHTFGRTADVPHDADSG